MNRYGTQMLVVGSILLAAAGQTAIKLGLSGGSFWTAMLVQWPLQLSRGVVIGLLVYGLGTLLWFAAVSRQNISYLYPLAASNYVLMGLAGHFLLHETMAPIRWCGILTMAGGIALLASRNERIAAS